MTAIIGFCLSNGAFLAADSARTDVDSGQQWNKPIKKIEQLRKNIVISTGGLGTIGHSARDQLISFVQTKMPALNITINKAQEIFSAAFESSFAQAPGHKIPLTCILAGRDDDGKGFICSLSSAKNFEPFWIKNVGQPYFTGSNTNIVMMEASNVIHELKKFDEKLMFDKWVIESVRKINNLDKTVAFPIQLVAVKEETLNIFPVDEQYTYLPEFETAFPAL